MPRFLSLHLMIVLLLGACAGDTGPTGPAGTQGQSGIQGPGGPEGPQGPEGLPLNWADVIEESEIDQPVYGIGLQVLGRTYVLGSGFAAHYSDAIWTNAHVARGLLDALDELSHLNPRPIAVRAGTVIGGSDTYDLTRYIIHHNYDGTTNSPDIGILISDTDLPSLASFLPREHATGLRVGQPIATIGFPGEFQSTAGRAGLLVSTFKDGTISALPLGEGTTLVQHNFDTTGGTSGSLIFDQLGWVVAVNHAGYEAIVFDVTTGSPERVGQGSLGFGIHVDAVWDLIDNQDSQSRQVTSVPDALAFEHKKGPTLQQCPHIRAAWCPARSSR